MNADLAFNRRTFISALLLLGVGKSSVLAQGFAGLGTDSHGFADVVRGKRLTFPADHGPHPEYRIEWWYLTANLIDVEGAAYGAQWTLFRQAMTPDASLQGWANRQLWMGNAALTSRTTHQFSERFARGGIGQAGVETSPFHAWIDAWDMQGTDTGADTTVSPLVVSAVGSDFSYLLNLQAGHPLVLQGDAGYSKKSDRGQASYYYSQPYFRADGNIVSSGKTIAVTGSAWMDREWSSQPLASDQTGWDWFSLHLASDEKLMLFRLRQTNGEHFFAGNWIGQDGQSVVLKPASIVMTPTATADVADRKVPTQWRIAIAERGLDIACVPLNPQSWMGTRFPYWEGPISFTGSHHGVGYLEMTGY